MTAAVLQRGAALLGAALFAIACQGPAGGSPPAGVVAAASPEAAAAGAEILAAGGNAVDAAVAVAFALAVTEPAGSGLGGQCSLLVHTGNGRVFAVNGSSFSPAATPATATRADLVGHRATTVPSFVRNLEWACREHGSGRLSWARLLEPAIRFAEQGYAIGPFRHRSLQKHADQLRQNPAAAALMLARDGSVPAAGSLHVQPALARTLRRLAEHGADDFYRGRIAQEIAADMAAHGGWITAEDLAAVPPPREVPALHTTYRGYDVHTLPPPAGGWVMLLILHLLERSTPAELADPTTRAERLAAALRLGHGSRRAPPLIDPTDYTEELQRRLDRSHADRLLQQGWPTTRGETTHFTVVDGDGTAVAVTMSINSYYGAMVATPGLGFLYNDYMTELRPGQPRHPFALRAGAMPYSSMSATVLSRDGEVCLALGSPGSSRIISAVAQVVSHWVDVGEGIAAAVAAPRLHVEPQQNQLYVESPETRARLRGSFEAAGFRIVDPAFAIADQPQLDPYFGGVHAIAREGGIWVGAADPRRDGAVRTAR